MNFSSISEGCAGHSISIIFLIFSSKKVLKVVASSLRSVASGSGSGSLQNSSLLVMGVKGFDVCLYFP